MTLILAAAVLFMGQASPNRTVETNEFILKDTIKDTNGKSRLIIQLRGAGQEPSLELHDANGKARDGRLSVQPPENERIGGVVSPGGGSPAS